VTRTHRAIAAVTALLAVPLLLTGRATATTSTPTTAITTTTTTPTTTTAPTTASGKGSTAADTGPRIDITSEYPTIQPDGTFLIQADLIDAPAEGRLNITLHPDPLADRQAFSRSLFGVDLGPRTVQVPPFSMARTPVDAGGVRHVTIVIALDRTLATLPGQKGLSRGLPGPGAYPVDLSLVDASGHQRARVITHLVRLPDASDASHAVPLRAAVVLGLDSPTSIRPDGTDRATTATFAGLAPTVDALAAVPDVALTIVPSPETVEALDRVSPATRRTLSRLRSSLRGRQVIGGPYVPVALTSWLNAGMGDLLQRERDRGTQILTHLLRRPDTSTWIAGADLTTDAASALAGTGVRQLIVRPGSFAALPTSAEEPTVARPFQVEAPRSGPMTAAAVDTDLQALFVRQTDPELTAYQLLAELAVIEGEAPTSTRGVLIDAPPDWQASGPFLTTLLRGLAHHPLLTPVTLDGLFREVAPARTGGNQSGAPVVRSLTPLPATDLGSYPADLARVRQKVAGFASMVGSTDPQFASWDQRLLLSGSAALPARTRDAYLSTIEDVIDGQVGLIDAPGRQTVTLTASDGSIPLSLRSRLKRPVKVVLSLESSSRLEFPDGTKIPRTLQPGAQQIRIRIRSRSPGDTPLTIRVLSPDSSLALADTRITVRATAVSGIGYVLSGGAVLFLVVWWVHNWRRGRRPDKEHEPDAGDPVAAEAGGART